MLNLEKVSSSRFNGVDFLVMALKVWVVPDDKPLGKLMGMSIRGCIRDQLQRNAASLEDQVLPQEGHPSRTT